MAPEALAMIIAEVAEMVRKFKLLRLLGSWANVSGSGSEEDRGVWKIMVVDEIDRPSMSR